MRTLVGRRDALAELLEGCVSDGILTPQQADAVRTRAQTSPPAEEHAGTGAYALEAFGYVGGVVVVVGGGLLVRQAWHGWGTTTRLALVAAAALLLLLAGALLPGRSGVATRLRSVLLLGSTVAVCAASLLVADQVIGLDEGWVVAAAMSAGAVYAAALWARWRLPTQELATVVLVAVAAASTVAALTTRPGWPGVAVVLVGMAWFAAAQARVVAHPVLVRPAAAVVILVGGLSSSEPDWGLVLALVLVAGILTLGVVLADLVLLGVGGVGLLFALPPAVGRWFPGSSAAGLVLLVAGGLIVVLVLWVSRRRARRQPRQASVGAGSPRA